ncbi:MAG: tetratricopeptide repeat protein, partial [Planctomycetota bacterium]|nr:tetratricopeptide repeat protein [Planctomycetota bacterium]
FFLSGRLRILDFGLAHLEGQESLTGSADLIGTPLYMSPEQAKRRKIDVDHRTDLYSLGATMYEVLTRRPPFRGRDHSHTLEQIIARDAVEPRRINPRIPRDLETIVLKCLRKDPEDRYGTAGALARDLERFVRSDPIEARPQSRWELLAGRLRRHRGKVSVTAALVFLLVLVGIFALRAHREESLRREDGYKPAVMAALMKLHQGDAVGGERASKEVGFYFPFVHPSYASFRRSDPDGREDPIAEAIEGFSAAAASVPGRADAYWHRARAHVLLGAEKDALADLDEALARNPELVPAAYLRAFLREETSQDDPKAHAILEAEAPTWAVSWLAAQLALKQNRPGETATRFQELVEALLARKEEPYIGALLEARIGLAVALAFDERPTDLLPVVSIVRDYWPESAQAAILEVYAYFMLGVELDRDEYKDKSESLLVSACEDFGNQIAFRAADFYLRFQDLDRVERVIDRIEPPGYQEFLRAKFHFLIGEYKNGCAALRRVVNLEPENVWVLTELASHERTEEALRLLRKACRLDPKNAAWPTMLAEKLAREGKRLQSQDKLDAARKECDRALALGPRTSRAWVRLGQVFTMLDGSDQGLQFFLKAIETEPNWDTYNHMASYYLGRKMWDDCINACERALALNPRLSWALRKKGEALEGRGGRGDEEEAVKWYCEAAAGWPPSAKPHGHLARIFESRGDVRERINWLLSGLTVDPGWRSDARNEVNQLLGDETTAAKADRGRLAEHLLALEEVSRRPDVSDRLLPTLAAIRKALRPDLVSYASIDAALEEPVPILDADDLLLEPARLARPRPGSATDRERFNAFLAAAHDSPSEDSSRCLDYFKGRLRQRAGDLEWAVKIFGELAERDLESREPVRRLAECLRALGRAAAAETALRDYLARSPHASKELWSLWTSIGLADLQHTPGELLDDELLTDGKWNTKWRARRPVADIRWLLERLQGGEPIHINCGGAE